MAILGVLCILAIFVLLRRCVIPYTRMALMCCTCLYTLYIAYPLHKIAMRTLANTSETIYPCAIDMVICGSWYNLR